MSPPYYADEAVTLHLGEMLDVLPTLPDASVDAVVCDPPYGLANLHPRVIAEALAAWLAGDRAYVPDGVGFMGRAWDRFVPPPAAWDECLRVLKPGGHLVAFAAPRTADLMGMSIRLAGFEIRDSISCSTGTLAWYYGSGFPKSRAVSRDPSFCQCLPPVRGDAAEDAAESAARLLLQDLRGAGKADASRLEDLHGVPVGLHPDYAVPSRAESDLLSRLQQETDLPAGEGASAEGPGEDHDRAVRPLRDGSRAIRKSGGADGAGLLLAKLPGQGSRPDAVGQRLRRDGNAARAEVRAGQPCLEGRGDVQAAEGQLHRPEVRPLPVGVLDDGPVGRVHRGAPPSDGPLDRASVAADGSREPHRSQPSEQRPVESGAVSVERGSQARRGWPVCGGCGKPQVPAGLGTALKPAWEPILVARRPLDGTVAANVAQYGTGSINVDACRVTPTGESRERVGEVSQAQRYTEQGGTNFAALPGIRGGDPTGRWPTNVLLAHPPLLDASGQPIGDACADGCVAGCPVAEMDQQTLGKRASKPSKTGSSGGPGGSIYGGGNGLPRDYVPVSRDDAGGASRFFPVFRYEAKAPASERPRLADGTAWPTVKPLALMRWLVRLITPPGGLVLDWCAGTGTTLEAAAIEGFRAIGVEREQQGAELCRVRLTKAIAPVLFGDIA